MKVIFIRLINAPVTLLFIAATVTGCASVTYEEPKSGPVARVRFVTDTPYITVIRGYSSKECNDEHEMMRLRNGFLFNSDPRSLGMPLGGYHKNAAKEFLITANIPQVYMFEHTEATGYYSYKCGVVIQQTFEEGKDYELSYHWNKPSCNIEVFELKKTGSDNIEKILLQKRDNKLISDFSHSCLTKFKQPRLY
ncbi:hypothetical protein [Candidatus Odyssella thessalonicensis]|uniref:hypothetical protein n=1 Tax=Candidatus Odyssella thessalonicensis TaxID=84647 RepID=UPI000318FCC3|nr:hypothetical protein [Candidatus Odyssella thessalonicensis]